MKILFVAGNFDDNGGRPSSVANKFHALIDARSDVEQIAFANGGYFSEIEDILEQAKTHDVVIWWANVPNDKPKIRDVKSVNPKTMLITSKRNDDNKYSFAELINRALESKANLCVEFSKQGETFDMMVFGPLGNCWFNGNDIQKCCDILINRIAFLKNITRQGCTNVLNENSPMIPDDGEFFDVIKNYAEIFHKLINPAPGVTRFLGNSSFRCQRGFPSFKKDGIIYVSRRNVDKRYIDKDSFVPTKFVDGKVFYYGDNKPSVDTPIQLRLYERLPHINYMIHSHVYIKDAPFTSHMIPCGGLEEVEEVMALIQKKYGNCDGDFYAINLVGHGSIIMSSDVQKLKNIDYVGRIFPEIHF